MSDIPIYKSKWQLQADEKFKIRFILDESSKKTRVIMLSDETPKTDQAVHWVEFNMWDYHTMVEIRKKATKYYNESGTFYVDNDLFNDMKIRYLLQNWSFAEIDPQMKLFHQNGMLVDESFVLFKTLYPWVVNEILVRMSAVLEGYEIK
jgi:hypothetical protein